MDKVKITIIGAGVIGLAIAAELSKDYEDIFLLEKNESFGQETSSRNSEVIHAGIYYPKDSLKLKLCLEGANYLYSRAKKYSIPYKRLGKLIIATHDSELNSLEPLFHRASENGVNGLKILDRLDIQKFETSTNAIAGIYSPSTGIIDSHALMKHFIHQAESRGVEIVYKSEVNLLSKEKDNFVIGLKNDEYRFLSRVVINCAGLFSDKVAELSGINIDEKGYRIHFCKGNYFSYSKPSPLKMLVYPLPHENCVGLGVHATLDMGARLKFGPDIEYVDHIDYKVNTKRQNDFYLAAKKIIPNLEKEYVIPDMAGIRPKLQGPHDPVKDFIIREEADLGLEGLINLIGIESPGLTACGAIGKMVSRMVAKVLC
ncbi:MAG: NAD(P)/FAD-dependent oxidoreductase [bacterium]